jgi:hypothetical protein
MFLRSTRWTAVITAGVIMLAATLASDRLAAQWILIDEICLENERSLQHMQ